MLSRLSSSCFTVAALAAGSLFLNATQAHAQAAPIDESAYADSVVDFQRDDFESLNSPDNAQWVYDPNAALGTANWDKEMTSRGSKGAWGRDIGYSLGKEGSLTLEFTDNYLTGSGDDKADLWIFEIGSVAEKILVEISMDGESWFDVGLADRKDPRIDWGIGIDIDQLLAEESLDPTSMFSFVRLTDEGSNNYRNYKAGADIDAVAALSSAPKEAQDVPEPAAAIALGLVSVGFLRRRLRG